LQINTVHCEERSNLIPVLCYWCEIAMSREKA
jgi:hypothetical protein